MDAVRKLILDRSVDLEKPLSELSLAIGKNHAYLQQFIKRGIPRRLDEETRPKLALLLDVAEAELKGPAKSPEINHTAAKVASPTLKPLPDTLPGSQLIGDRDLPVYAAAQGGPGVIIVSNEPVEWVSRPQPLARVKEGYGVYVLDGSMSPEFEPGDIALVHPHKTPTAGVTCIFKAHTADGTIKAVIKRLRRVTADTWHVRQWSPPAGEKADYTLKRSEWQECQVTVGRYSRG